MPIYEYACQKCGHAVELMQKISDPPPKKCERCGGRMARVISQTSFQLKGGGWYKDLYSSSPAGSGKSEANSEKKTEAKTEKKEPAAKPAAKKDKT